MKITSAVLMLGTGCTAALAAKWIEPIQFAMDRYDINTPKRIGCFLANIGVESGGLTQLVENMNYDAAGLARVWPSRYRGPDGKPNALANQLSRKPVDIANHTYANRMGNGSPASGDGWKYRGRGLKQNTGKAEYQRLEFALGLPLVDEPERLQEPVAAALSAANYFQAKGCNGLADQTMYSKVVERINGVLPNTANQGELRLSRTRAVVKELG